MYNFELNFEIGLVLIFSNSFNKEQLEVFERRNDQEFFKLSTRYSWRFSRGGNSHILKYWIKKEASEKKKKNWKPINQIT